MKSIRFLSIILTVAAISNLVVYAQPANKVKQNFIQNYDKLILKIAVLDSVAQMKPINWQNNKKAFFEARLAYKKTELLLCYLDNQFVNDHINGAPLLKTERKAPNLVVLAPNGFQISEELLFEEDEEKYPMRIKKLHSKLSAYRNYLPRLVLNERMVFEATREELVRLAAMGISGFDSPCLVNNMAENEIVVFSIENTISEYLTYLNEADKSEIANYFKHAKSYFEQQSFDSFNRFGFIQNFINPLYKKLLEIQKSLNIETRDLVYKTAFSINYNATNIFDTDFLNANFYAQYSNSGNLEERISLGKLLFFDPIMSHNNQRACASCHHPDKAFSDGLKKSTAFNGQDLLARNSPGLINSIYNTRFFWDARAAGPEEQVEHVLFNPAEFNSNYEEVIEKIKTIEAYLKHFDRAYPRIKTINRYTIVASISAYIQSLRSFNSNFDKAMKGEKNSDQKMIAGFNIFAGKGKCATCHFIPTFAGNLPPLYTDTETEVLGIPNNNNSKNALLDSDQGRYANGRPTEHAEIYKHSFKTPTLRNISLTAPYMHNGVFNTLEDVVEFYNIGGGHGWGIAPENTTLPSDSLNLTEKEKDELIYFMKQLTDTTGLTSMPSHLPLSTKAELNARTIGGKY